MYVWSVPLDIRGLADPFQTELAINTHVVVADTKTVVTDTQTVVVDTQTMVADIHRNVLAGSEGSSNQNNLVGTVRSFAGNQFLIFTQTQARSEILNTFQVRDLTFP